MTMRRNFLEFGGVEHAAAVDASGALAFLQDAGFADGVLAQARAGVRSRRDSAFEFEAIGVNYCDFCFAQLMGGEYDRLEDGRERCIRCSRTVVRTREDFVDLFTSTRRLFELAFEMTIDVAMQVHMVSAREIARRSGETFVATSGVDPRVLGFATRSDEGFALNIENGAPALAAMTTIVHELTHIWQFSTWAPGMIEQRYGDQRRLIVAEGMASWAQVQYLLCVKEFEYAERQEALLAMRDDEYGIGFQMFCERYPLSEAGVVGRETPFQTAYPL
jgi:hypothetical protein